MYKTISVIIPNYNNANYLSKCIDSVLSQTYPIKEIVIFDDASTDSSAEVLDYYEKQNAIINVIYSQNNVGVSAARNIAVSHTTSEYVTMIDADDFYWDKDKLKREMYIANRTSEPVCVFSQTIKVDEEGVPYQQARYIDLSKHVRWKTITRLFGIYAPRDYCFPKRIFIELGGYLPDMTLYEDWELNLRFMTKCKFIYSHGFGTAYRQKRGGLSDVEAKKHYLAKKRAYENNAKVLGYTVYEKLTFHMLNCLNYIRKVIRIRKL